MCVLLHSVIDNAGQAGGDGSESLKSDGEEATIAGGTERADDSRAPVEGAEDIAQDNQEKECDDEVSSTEEDGSAVIPRNISTSAETPAGSRVSHDSGMTDSQRSTASSASSRDTTSSRVEYSRAIQESQKVGANDHETDAVKKTARTSLFRITKFDIKERLVNPHDRFGQAIAKSLRTTTKDPGFLARWPEFTSAIEHTIAKRRSSVVSSMKKEAKSKYAACKMCVCVCSWCIY